MYENTDYKKYPTQDGLGQITFYGILQKMNLAGYRHYLKHIHYFTLLQPAWCFLLCFQSGMFIEDTDVSDVENLFFSEGIISRLSLTILTTRNLLLSSEINTDFFLTLQGACS